MAQPKGIWHIEGRGYAIELRIPDEVQEEMGKLLSDVEMGFSDIQFTMPSSHGLYPFAVVEKVIPVQYRITRREGEGVKPHTHKNPWYN